MYMQNKAVYMHIGKKAAGTLYALLNYCFDIFFKGPRESIKMQLQESPQRPSVQYFWDLLA